MQYSRSNGVALYEYQILAELRRPSLGGGGVEGEGGEGGGGGGAGGGGSSDGITQRCHGSHTLPLGLIMGDESGMIKGAASDRLSLPAAGTAVCTGWPLGPCV